MGVNYGIDAKLYRGTAGSAAATLVNNVRNDGPGLILPLVDDGPPSKP